MLDAVLDPFHRPAGDARGDGRQHHIGKHGKLDAETAAAVGRNAHPESRAGHAHRPRHHRMGAERALEIRQHVVAVVGRIILRDHDVAFHRRVREPRIIRGELDDPVGFFEGALGVAVGKFAHRNFVGLGFRVQQGRGFLARLERIDHRRQRAIFDAHEIGRVLGEIAVLGDDKRDRLADIAHAPDRERPLMHRRLERDQERIGKLLDVLAGDHRPDARRGERLRPCRFARFRRAHGASG